MKLQKEKHSIKELNLDAMVQIVHDLRSPLHCVLSFSDLGRKKMDKLSSEKLEDYMNEIHKSGQQCLELVEQMFEAKRNPFLDIKPKMAVCDMQQLVMEVIAQLECVLEAKNLSIAFDSAPEKFVGYFDSKLLGRVLMNLLSNAIKFSPRGKSIEICLEEVPVSPVDVTQARPHLLLSVSDEGLGVPDMEQTQIFEQYSMGSNSDPSGLGLGLFISKAIIEAHNGSIWAENKKGGGACFIIAIPFVKIKSVFKR